MAGRECSYSRRPRQRDSAIERAWNVERELRAVIIELRVSEHLLKKENEKLSGAVLVERERCATVVEKWACIESCNHVECEATRYEAAEIRRGA